MRTLSAFTDRTAFAARIALMSTSTVLTVLPNPGCASAPPPPPVQTTVREPRPQALVPLRIVAHTAGDGRLTLQAYDAQELYGRGTALFQAMQCEEAVLVYDQLVNDFPGSRWVEPALFDSGACLQERGQWAAAAERFRRLRRVRPDGARVREATFRLAKVLLELERYEEALAVADGLLALNVLPFSERAEALSQRCRALLGLGHLQDAQLAAQAALGYVRNRPADRPRSVDSFAAASAYVLAEAYRRTGEATVVVATGAQAADPRQALLNRARYLLAAQRAYSDAIGFDSGPEAQWRVAAGQRLGPMYDALWAALRTVATRTGRPPAGPGRAVVQRELAVLLEPTVRHGLRYWELALGLVEQGGSRPRWVVASKAELSRVRRRWPVGH